MLVRVLKRLFATFILTCLYAALMALSLLGMSPAVHAAIEPLSGQAPQVSPRYVAPAGANTGGCTDSAQPCLTIQYAVDQAEAGDEIRVAFGTYTGVQTRSAPAGYPGPSVITQALYLTKSVTVQGGYTADFTAWNPALYTSTLDAQGQGRVVFIGGAISPTLDSLNLFNGSASGVGGHPLFNRDAGGGLYVMTATATLNNLNVVSNTSPFGLNGGGGIFWNHSASTLSHSTIEKNLAGFVGGGIDLFRSDGATVRDNLIMDNEANVGGGVHAYRSGFTLSGNTLQSNTGSGGGAGVYLENSDLPDHQPTLTRNAIVSNTAADAFSVGGGLYLYFSDPLMNGNLLQGNQADQGGGAYFSMSEVASTNDVIRANQATRGGAGLYLDGSQVVMQHATLAAGSGGDGSGVLLKINSDFVNPVASTLAMTNVIIVEHTLGITVSAGNTVTLNSVLWFNNAGGDTTGAGTVQVLNALTAAPQFALDGYHLISTSPAIDAGVNSGVSDDIDGEVRPYGTAPDLGADEYIIFKIYLPLALRNF